MRHFLSVVLILILSLAPIYSYTTDIDVGLDLASIDAAWNKSLYTRVKVEASITKNLSIRIPISYSLDFSSHYNLITCNFDIYYYMLEKGPFIGLSVYSFAYLFAKDLPSDLLFSLSELTLGYNYEFYKNMYLEPSLIIRNPCDIYTEFKTLQTYFPRFSKLRFSLIFGYKFKNIKVKGEDNDEKTS